MGIRIGASFGPLYVSTRLWPRRRRRGSASPGLLAACVLLTVWMIQAAVWLLIAAGVAVWWLARGIAHLITEWRRTAAQNAATKPIATPPAAQITAPPTAPAGWYTDPRQADRLRYYDGHAWSDQVAISDPAQSADTGDEGLVTHDAVLPFLDPSLAAEITRT